MITTWIPCPAPTPLFGQFLLLFFLAKLMIYAGEQHLKCSQIPYLLAFVKRAKQLGKMGLPRNMALTKSLHFYVSPHLASITLTAASVKFTISGSLDQALQSHVDRYLAFKRAPVFLAVSSRTVGESPQVPSRGSLVSAKHFYSMGFGLLPRTV